MIAELVTGVLSEVARSLRPRNATIENPTYSLQDPRTWDDMLEGRASTSGIHVSHGDALAIAAVWQAVSIISGDVACMPMNVMLKDEHGDREIDVKHHAQFRISQAWNDETPAYEGWRRMMVHALIWGQGFAYMSRQGRIGDIDGIYTLLPDRTYSARDSRGRLFYVTEVDGRVVPLLREEVLHLKGLSCEPGCAIDWIQKARNSLGLTLAAETWNNRFFANGAGTGGILMIPPTFTDKAAMNLEEGFRKRYSGSDNWFRTAILRDGAKFAPITVDAEKSQMHELRTDQVREIARFFNLPPFKLGIEDSVSYNSTEQAQRIYLASTLIHWITALRTEVELKTVSEEDRRKRLRSIELNPKKLVEADLKTLNDVLIQQRNAEIINANEVRQQLGMKRRTDPGGDEYRNPNTSSNAAEPQEPDDTGDEPDESTQGSERNDIERYRRSHQNLLRAEALRLTKRLTAHARTASKDSSKFCDWLDNGPGKSMQSITESLRSHTEVTGDESAADCAALRIIETVRSAMQPLLDEPASKLVENVNVTCERLESEVPALVVNLIWSDANVTAA